ncbi:MAG: outer membrane protein transport protein [Proteobacteria bacterium]|nr:outer membrane protein transport protein [Pseudomonadota bacterium]
MMTRTTATLYHRASIALVLAGLSTAMEPNAWAGGLLLPTRGVQPTARAGAFVAGGRGTAALGINPAGLAAGADDREFLLDLSYVRHDISYTRLDSNFLERDPVKNGMAGIPIPTLALSVAITDRLTMAGGIYAPYTGAGDYPADGAQRYSLVSVRGSLLLIGELSLGYRLSDRIRFGVGLQNMYYKLAHRMTFSVCPRAVLCNPEDPAFDMAAALSQESPVNLSGIAGVQVDLGERVRAGAAFQLPYNLSSTGTLDATMPDLGIGLDLGQVQGEASVALTLPPSLRAGIEFAPWRALSIELALAVEFWSHSEQLNVRIEELNVAGLVSINPGDVADTPIPLGLRDTYALMAGVQATPSPSLPLTLMAGYAYETSAATEEYMNIFTVDGNKHLVTAGLTIGKGRLRVHAVLGAARVNDTTVSPDKGIYPQVNPLLSVLDQAPAAYVNWGQYRSSWLIAGAGVSGRI